jgi:hypothetical protein
MGRTVIPCVFPFLGTLKKISECDWPVLARLPRLIHFKPSPLDAAPHLPCLLKIQLWPCGLTFFGWRWPMPGHALTADLGIDDETSKHHLSFSCLVRRRRRNYFPYFVSLQPEFRKILLYNLLIRVTSHTVLCRSPISFSACIQGGWGFNPTIAIRASRRHRKTSQDRYDTFYAYRSRSA